MLDEYENWQQLIVPLNCSNDKLPIKTAYEKYLPNPCFCLAPHDLNWVGEPWKPNKEEKNNIYAFNKKREVPWPSG